MPRHMLMHTPLATGIGILLAAIVAVGCGSSTPSSPTPSGTTPPGTTPPAPTGPPPPGATAAMVAEGETLFRQGSCPICHGQGGRNGPFGPDLTDAVFLHNSGGFEEIVSIITSGVPADQLKSPSSQRQFFMQPRGGMAITEAQLRAIAAYVWTLSHPTG